MGIFVDQLFELRLEYLALGVHSLCFVLDALFRGIVGLKRINFPPGVFEVSAVGRLKVTCFSLELGYEFIFLLKFLEDFRFALLCELKLNVARLFYRHHF